MGNGHHRPFPDVHSWTQKIILMVTNYFIKWAEAEALERVREQEVQKFLWKQVICRFGIPWKIIIDNGPQFIAQTLKDFCGRMNIKLTYSTPRYPQANGQAEAFNKAIVNSLKNKLEGEKGLWLEALPKVLWAFTTTPRALTLQTPFSMVYETEVVLLTEIHLPKKG